MRAGFTHLQLVADLWPQRYDQRANVHKLHAVLVRSYSAPADRLGSAEIHSSAPLLHPCLVSFRKQTFQGV